MFSPGSEVNKISREEIGSDLRVFKYSVDGKKFLASSWVVFVKSNFANNPWTVILSESEDSIFSSIHDFKNTFLLITLLALILTLFLSLILIRRNLEPLHLLKEGTEKIADGNFSVMLDIQSGDEFEDLGSSFNSMTRQLHKQFTTLATIDKIDRAILSSLDQAKVIDTSLKMLKGFFQVDVIVLGRLVDPSNSRMKIYTLQLEQETTIEYVTITEEEKNRIFTKDPHSIISKEYFPVFLQGIHPAGSPQIVCLPLVIEKQLQSVLLLGHTNKHDYTEEELKQARQLADQVTIALSNSTLVRELENLITGTIEALARAVDAKSKWTAGHSERVAVLAGKIGKHMGLTDHQTELLNRGGLLHDIGKIGIPISIIDKPGKLTADEYDEIKTHPLIGQQILAPIEVYRDIIPMVAQHHENYDGSGYPFGLAGKNIAPLARILSVADVFDALISNRPYRSGWVLDKAKNFIIEGAGSQFDPEVVDSFLELS